MTTGGVCFKLSALYDKRALIMPNPKEEQSKKDSLSNKTQYTTTDKIFSAHSKMSRNYRGSIAGYSQRAPSFYNQRPKQPVAEICADTKLTIKSLQNG